MSDKRHLIVVDTETTGLDPTYHWPLEVAAINCTTGDELYFVPALPSGALDQADGNAMRINRYFERGTYKKRLSKADSENRWNELWEWLTGNTLGGSNPTFDAAMLQQGYGWTTGDTPGTPWHRRLADLSAYAAGALHLPPTELAGLDDVCTRLGIDRVDGSAHTAGGDARATAQAFHLLAERYTQHTKASGT